MRKGVTGASIVFTQSNFYVAVSFVFVGQFITIISRPISRIKTIEKKVLVHAEEEKENNEVIEFV